MHSCEISRSTLEMTKGRGRWRFQGMQSHIRPKKTSGFFFGCSFQCSYALSENGGAEKERGP